MNGFADKGLNESDFGSDSSPGYNVVKAFDAFPKTKASYTEKTSNGGIWTIILVCASVFLSITELQRWWTGYTTHNFAVEQGIGRDLQINLDIVVKMPCDDVRVNIQDASGDLVVAGEALTMDLTNWTQWNFIQSKLQAIPADRKAEYKMKDVHDYLGRPKSRKAFQRTPRIRRGMDADSCRIFGTLHTNKVQGDFHITARGHGYMDAGQHLDHQTFNFSHYINELSFGPYYPNLVNPLDHTYSTTDDHFYKYQYYLSVVPTIYTTDIKALRMIDKYHESPSSGSDGLDQHPRGYSRNTVFTNQYAVTEQSRPIMENNAPGVFVKFDIEPILLTIAEEWSSIPALFIRLVNVVSGVIVTGGWIFQLTHWAQDARRQRKGDLTSSILSPVNSRDEKHSL